MTLPGGQLALNVFLAAGGYHAGSWRRAGSRSDELVSLPLMIDLARTAERARLDAVFVSDAMGLEDKPRSNPRLIELEPVTLISALAAATRSVGVIGTMSTTFTHPFNMARYLASIDHISGGRAGWNIVTSSGGNENFGRVLPAHDERYAVAAEYLDVVTALWDSWDDDAVINDRDSGTWVRPDRVHRIDHHGTYFHVRGPAHLPRSPQGWPVLVQAGSSRDGMEFAARYAEVVFTAQPDLDHALAFARELRTLVAAAGRDPGSVKILPGLMPILGDTERAATELADELAGLVPLDAGMRTLTGDLAGVDLRGLSFDEPVPRELLPPPETVSGTRSRYEIFYEFAAVQRKTLGELFRISARSMGHRTSVGTAEQVADEMELWFTSGACDGFNLQMAYSPGSLEVIADQLVPELQRRGLFRTEYRGTTLRDNLGLPVPRGSLAAR